MTALVPIVRQIAAGTTTVQVGATLESTYILAPTIVLAQQTTFAFPSNPIPGQKVWFKWRSITAGQVPMLFLAASSQTVEDPSNQGTYVSPPTAVGYSGTGAILYVWDSRNSQWGWYFAS